MIWEFHLLTLIQFLQNRNFNLKKLVDASAQGAYDNLKSNRLPVFGALTKERRDEIIKALTDSKDLSVPDIFEQPKAQFKAEPPEQVYKRVVADLGTISPDLAFSTRYLSLYAIPPDERKEHIIISSFALNSLSWSHQIVWPEVVPGSDNGLLRFNALNYVESSEGLARWLEAWEAMTDGDVTFGALGC